MDHLGGLLYNLRNKIKLSIEEVWMNHGSLMGKNAELSVKQNDEVYTALKEQGIPVKPVIAGTTYELDGAVFRVLWPDVPMLKICTMKCWLSKVGVIALRNVVGKEVVETMSPEFVDFIQEAYQRLRWGEK